MQINLSESESEY